MQSAYNTPPLNLTGQPAAELDVDLLVIPVFVDDAWRSRLITSAASPPLAASLPGSVG